MAKIEIGACSGTALLLRGSDEILQMVGTPKPNAA